MHFQRELSESRSIKVPYLGEVVPAFSNFFIMSIKTELDLGVVGGGPGSDSLPLDIEGLLVSVGLLFVYRRWRLGLTLGYCYPPVVLIGERLPFLFTSMNFFLGSNDRSFVTCWSALLSSSIELLHYITFL